MNRSKIYFLAFVLVSQLLFATTVFAKTSMWKVSKGDDYFYLGGTVHVLSAEDYPLPDEFAQAYNDASEIIFEVDFKVATSQSFINCPYLLGIALCDSVGF